MSADRPNGRQAPAAAAFPGGDPPPAPSQAGRATDPIHAVRRAEAALAEAASTHWQREHDLAEAEAAMQEVKDRLETLDQQRMQLRRDTVAAEQDLATARAAQRAALRAVTEARRALETAEKQLPDR